MIVQASLSSQSDAICKKISTMMSIGERIRKVRRKLRLSQAQFGEPLDVSRGAVGNWERDLGIKRENLVQIAKTYNVSLEWLSGETEEPPEILTIDRIASGNKGEPIDHVLADVACDMAIDFQKENGGGSTEDFLRLVMIFYRQLKRRKQEGLNGSVEDH
jgi:transcriptional regulator with XRE-family HTH domain